jgi:hypothetical protein
LSLKIICALKTVKSDENKHQETIQRCEKSLEQLYKQITKDNEVKTFSAVLACRTLISNFLWCTFIILDGGGQ